MSSIDLNSISVAALPWMGAGAWKLCSDSGQNVGFSVDGKHLEFGLGYYPDRLHATCGGTGRIYALPDTVRPVCGHTPTKATAEEWAEFREWHDKICPGWTPSTDLAVLEKAVFVKWPKALIEKQAAGTWFTPNRYASGSFKGDGVGLEALHSALAQALFAAGCMLGEVPAK